MHIFNSFKIKKGELMVKNAHLHHTVMVCGLFYAIICGCTYVHAAEPEIGLLAPTQRMAGSTQWVNPERIMRGGNIASYLLSGQNVPDEFINNLETYLNSIADLIWFFYSEAINKGQRFDEGTFVLLDPEFRFYGFLMNYVKRVNTDIKDDPRKDPASMSSSNPFGYSRLSSHYTTLQYNHSDVRKIGEGYTGLYRHYGIDTRFDNKLDLNVLPTGNKTHLLFGKIQNNPDMIFIKMEKAGIYAQPAAEAYPGVAAVSPSVVTSALDYIPGPEQAAHAVHWVQAQIPKLLERSLPANLVDSMRDWIDFDDNQNNRKERCPVTFINDVIVALGNSALTPNLYASFMRLSNLLGIKFAYLLSQYVETGDSNVFNILRAFTRTYAPNSLAREELLLQLAEHLHKDKGTAHRLRAVVRKNMAHFDCCELRTGREVVFTPSNLFAAFYYRDLSTGKIAPREKELYEELQAFLVDCRRYLNAFIESEYVDIQAIARMGIRSKQLVTRAEELENTNLLRSANQIKIEWRIMRAIFEDQYIVAKRASLLPEILKSIGNPAVWLGSMPYKQLLRSVQYVEPGPIKDVIISVLQAQINRLLKEKVLDDRSLPYVLQGVPEELVARIVPAEKAESVLKVLRGLDERQRQQLTTEIFGNRIVLYNRFAALRGNPKPRLLIKAFRRNRTVLWQAILEHNTLMDIGSCDANDQNNPYSISYEPYGELEQTKAWLGSFLGFASTPKEIAISELIQRCPHDATNQLIVEINSSTEYATTHRAAQKLRIDAQTTLQDLFPSVQYWVTQKQWAYSFEALQKNYPLDLARYILGLPKTALGTERLADESGVHVRYERLLREFDPRLYPDNARLIDQAIGYLHWAHRTIEEIFKKTQP